MEENNDKKRIIDRLKGRRYFNRTVKRTALIIDIILILFTILLYFEVGSANITHQGAVNVSMSISGLMITCVLFLLIMGDHREISHSDSCFIVTLIILSCSLFFSVLSWYEEGRPNLAWALYITEAMVVVFGNAMVLSFYEYLLNTVLIKKREALRPLTIILIIIFAAGALVAITNPLTDLMFTVSETGYEMDGLFIFLVHSEMFYPFWLLIFVWVFIAIYDGNRRKLEQKKHDIETAANVIKGILPKEGEDIEFTPEMQALVDSRTIPNAMKLAALLTAERVRRMSGHDN